MQHFSPEPENAPPTSTGSRKANERKDILPAGIQAGRKMAKKGKVFPPAPQPVHQFHFTFLHIERVENDRPEILFVSKAKPTTTRLT
ncbi:biotin attachment protein [Anopheles sinensis]|uniref:Biotin attachment protein n=1 Tax=Anopheles sinensis TaxID=74873 RepID=A0A084VPH7_ANOSI|nr:biotin attachment protein [Anopheles sinensis]